MGRKYVIIVKGKGTLQGNVGRRGEQERQEQDLSAKFVMEKVTRRKIARVKAEVNIKTRVKAKVRIMAKAKDGNQKEKVREESTEKVREECTH